MTLAELITDIDRRAAEAAAIGATAPVAAVLGDVLVRLKAVDAPVQKDTGADDRMLTVEQVATRLNFRTKYIYEHWKKWPFARKLGSKLRFSEQGLERWERRPS